MKIAVLIAGEYREFAVAHKFWSFLNWEDVDCYFATWNVSVFINQNKRHPDITELINEESIRKYINPKAIDISEKFNTYIYNPGYMLDRWHAVIRLMSESNVNYDRVILIRPDLALNYEEEVFKSFVYNLSDTDEDIYGLIGGALNKPLDLLTVAKVSDLMLVGTSQSVQKLLEIPLTPWKIENISTNGLQERYHSPALDIHEFLAKHFNSLFKRFMNIPIPKFCVVRSNCRDLVNPTFNDCKLKAKEWWETRYNSFYHMGDNIFDSTHAPIEPFINRDLPNKDFNLWNKFNFINPNVNQTIKWKAPDTREQYRINKANVSLNSEFTTYGENDIEYCHNSYGFRKSSVGPGEFEEAYGYPTFLAAGCSNTEGIGVKEEHLWHSILVNFLSTRVSNRPIAKFNLGKGGSSAESAIRLVYVAIEHKNCKPDIVYFLLPPPQRKEIILEKSKDEHVILDFLPNCQVPGDLGLKHQQLLDTLRKDISDVQFYHDYFGVLLFIKYYLETKNIAWYFSCWAGDLERPVGVDFPKELTEHYIEHKLNYDVHVNPSYKKLFKENIARDYAHFGPPSHYEFADNVFNEMIKRSSFEKFKKKWTDYDN